MARPRAYHHSQRCPHCASNWTPKDGRSRGKQTYRCGDCHHRFTPDGNRHYFPEAIKRQAIDMYAEGMGIAAISRILDVRLATVFSWVKKSSAIDGVDEPGGAASGEPRAGAAAGQSHSL